jgi:uncharacterized repeat protein (TIGR03803 family)
MIKKSSRCRSALTLFTIIAVGLFPIVIPLTAHAQTYTDIHDFLSTEGAPYALQAIAQGRDGNIYGTLPNGGSASSGTVFRATPSGKVTIIYSFDGTTGAVPYSGLTLGSDGSFYGTTYGGGANSLGTVFKITSAGNPTFLHSFNGSDGTQPYFPPIEGKDGNFYGTTYGGFAYKISSTGAFKLLTNALGGARSSPITQASDGNFYGATDSGGTGGCGAIFRMSTSGAVKVIYNFDGTHGCASPFIQPLVQGPDGFLYGTAFGGGTFGSGVVFKVSTGGVLKVLHNIDFNKDGNGPEAGLVLATDGNFYGATYNYGAGYGTLFRIAETGSFKKIYSFDYTHGANDETPAIQHTNGKIYGLTDAGGSNGAGVLFTLDIGVGPFVSLVPTSGKVGGKPVGILGQGFSSSSVVKFDGVQATSVKRTGTTFLSATVPPGALTGSVTVTTGSTTLTSNQQFRVTPQKLSFTPTSGKVGTPVTITGVSLTQTTKVTFGGVKATTFTVNSDTKVTANVPTGAKTGKIAVTTLGGTAISAAVFTVTQ